MSAEIERIKSVNDNRKWQNCYEVEAIKKAGENVYIAGPRWDEYSQ